jgi:hypothetical protein
VSAIVLGVGGAFCGADDGNQTPMFPRERLEHDESRQRHDRRHETVIDADHLRVIGRFLRPEPSSRNGGLPRPMIITVASGF